MDFPAFEWLIGAILIAEAIFSALFFGVDKPAVVVGCVALNVAFIRGFWAFLPAKFSLAGSFTKHILQTGILSHNHRMTIFGLLLTELPADATLRAVWTTHHIKAPIFIAILITNKGVTRILRTHGLLWADILTNAILITLVHLIHIITGDFIAASETPVQDFWAFAVFRIGHIYRMTFTR